MTNNKILKKKIIYRSTHRGTKEMDLLLGSFVKKYINSFDSLQLNELNKILSLEDDVIYKWYFQNNSKNVIQTSNVSILLKNFKL